jgi:hypothetical protein
MKKTVMRDRFENISKRNFRQALNHLLENDYKIVGSHKILELLSEDIEELQREFNYSKDKIGYGEILFRTTKDNGQRQRYGKKTGNMQRRQ